MLKRTLTAATIVATALIVVACTTSPTGRSQLHFFPEDQLEAMGAQAYSQMKEQTPTLESGPRVAYVQCVASAIVSALPGASPSEWEVTVFQSEAVNAFALPGGKIGVYTGLLEVAEGPDQLAAVLGHEVGHVLADHANARLSTRFATNAGVTLLAILAGTQLEGDQRAALALLGLGAQVGILLPYGRSQESEADIIGLELMAKAGFDPRESVALWRNMAEAGGGAPPEFLSTHPSHATRIDTLSSNMDEAVQLYQQAQASGRTPDCDASE